MVSLGKGWFPTDLHANDLLSTDEYLSGFQPIFGGNWSGAQLSIESTNRPSHGAGDADDEEEGLLNYVNPEQADVTQVQGYKPIQRLWQFF